MHRPRAAALFIAAAALLATPQAASAFGALALDAGQGPSYGFAYDFSTSRAAQDHALKQCGANCKVVVTFNNTCAAFAADQAPGGTAYGWGYAPNKDTAQATALKFCRQYGGKDCLVRVWACEGRITNSGIARFENEIPATLVVSRPPTTTTTARTGERTSGNFNDRSSTGRTTTVTPPAPPPTEPVKTQPPPVTVVSKPPVVQPPVVQPQTPVTIPTLSSSGSNRYALVIGNDRYAELPSLQKAVNDARAVDAALARLGFTVIRVENAPRREFNQKLVEFANKVGRGDTAFFFFAGHGVEINGQNYLLAVDVPQAREKQEALIASEGILADNIIFQLQDRGAKVTMLVLDACRENPFKRTGTRGVGATRGLGQMTAPEGVFVIYSAGVGQTALDRLSNEDPNPNSVFTRTFVTQLAQPGMTVQTLAKLTQAEVHRLAGTVNHQQMPAYYDQILGLYTLTPTPR